MGVVSAPPLKRLLILIASKRVNKSNVWGIYDLYLWDLTLSRKIHILRDRFLNMRFFSY